MKFYVSLIFQLVIIVSDEFINLMSASHNDGHIVKIYSIHLQKIARYRPRLYSYLCTEVI